VSNAEYLRPKQASERYSIAAGTLANFRVKRLGPPFVKHGSIILYPVQAFEAWLASGLQPADDDGKRP
jgi:hypothetical protein